MYTKSYEDAGEWDAAANSPELTETDSAKAGKKYYVTTGGTRFGITFTEGEYAVYDAEGNIFADNGEQTGYTCTIEPTEAAGIYKWYAVLSAGTEGEAQTELGKLTHKKTLETKTRAIKFGVDYELGDKVRIQKKVGAGVIGEKKRISAVRFYNENGTCGETITFEEE